MPAPTSRMVDGAYQRRDTQVPPYEWDGSLFVVWGKREGRRPPPREGWGRRLSALPGGAPSADGAFGRFREFAPCAARVFRWLRPAGISPVATGDQRLCLWTPRFWAARRPLARVVAEEFCVMPAVWVRSHTGCMARNRTAGMAQKARRAPQTHGRWAAPQEKNRVKLL